jgi:hypothetical protein
VPVTPPGVITLGESMALFVADEPGALADAERFSNFDAASFLAARH